MARAGSITAKAYAKNVMKSTKFITTETLKGISPEFTTFVTDTRDSFKEMKKSLKGGNNNIKKNIENLLGKETIENVKTLKNNFMSDLRTGKFYNTERDEEVALNALKGLGFDTSMFNFDEDDEDVVESTSSESSASTRGQTIADKIAMAELTGSDISATRINSRSRRNTKAMMMHNERMFGVINNSLSVINSSIMNLHQDIAKPMNAHIVNSANFYSTATQELAKQTSYLEGISAMLQDRFAPTDSKWGSATSSFANSDWNKVMGSTGVPKLSNWKKVVVDRTIKKTGILDMLNPDMLNMFITSLSASPVSTLASMFLPSLFSKGVKGSLDRTVDIFRSGVMKSALGIHKLATNKRGGFLSKLASFIDIVPDSKDVKADFGNYNKGRSDWTGKDSKALRDVIPTQLAAILAAITGQEAKVFDYDKGKFVKAGSLYNGINDLRSKNISTSVRGSRNEVISGFIEEDKKQLKISGSNLLPYTTKSRASVELANDFDKLIFLINTIPGANGQKIDLTSISSESEFIRAFTFFTKEPFNISMKNLRVIAKNIFKSNSSYTKFTASALAAKMDDNDFMASAGTSFGASANVHNGSELSEYHKHGFNALDKYLDDKGHSVFFYLQDYYDQLRAISNKIGAPSSRYSASNKEDTDYVSEDARKFEASSKRTRERKAKRLSAKVAAARGEDTSHSDRDVIDSDGSVTSYEDYEQTVSASSRASREKEEKKSFVARGIDKIGDFFDNVIFGSVPDAIKKTYINEGGLIGLLKNMPNMIATAVTAIKDKAKDWLSQKWASMKESPFYKDFIGESKRMIKDHFKNSFEYGKNTVTNFINDNFRNPGVPHEATISADPSGSYRGGQVTRSGVASVSEGELIIPANMNPNYNGKMTDSARRFVEHSNWNEWRKDNEDYDGEFFGFFAKGGSVKGRKNNNRRKALSKKVKRKIRALYNEGYSAQEISKEVKKPIGQVKRVIAGSEIKGTAEVAADTIEDAVSNAVNSEAADTVKKALRGAAKLIGDKITTLVGEDKVTNMKSVVNEATRAAKVNLPKTLASGGLGAIIGGALTGSGIGLLGGFVVGAGINILNNSTELTEKLFGTQDEAGEWSGGKIPKKAANFIKNRLPKTGKAGTVGAILGTLGLAPGGVFGGLVIGAGLELVHTTDTFKNIMFGAENVYGERNGGIMGALRYNVVDPLTKFVKDGMGKISDYLKKNFLEPTKNLLNPVRDWIKGSLGRAKQKLADKVKEKVKRTIGEKFGAVLKPVAEKVGAAGKYVLGLPGRVYSSTVNKATEKLRRHNARVGYSTLTPQERMELENETVGHGPFKRQFRNNNYTRWASTTSEENLRKAATFMNGKSDVRRQIIADRQRVADKVTASLTDGGMSHPEHVKKIKKLFNTNQVIKEHNYQGVIQYISTLGEDVMGSNTKELVIKEIQNLQDREIKKVESMKTFDQDSRDFFRDEVGLTSERQIAKFAKFGRYQSKLDVEGLDKVKGKKDAEDLKKAQDKDNAKKLLEQQEKENPIDQKRNNILTDIRDIAIGIANKLGIKVGINDKSNGLETSAEIDQDTAKPSEETPIQNAVTNVTGGKKNKNHFKKLTEDQKSNIRSMNSDNKSPEEISDALNIPIQQVRQVISSSKNKNASKSSPSTTSELVEEVLPGAKYSNAGEHTEHKNNSFERPKEAPEGTKRTEFNGLGEPVEYIYQNGEWRLNEADASTNIAVEAQREDREIRNSFYRKIMDGSIFGGILASLRGMFLGDKEGTDKKLSLWDRMKNGGLRLFNNLGLFFKGLGGFFKKILKGLGDIGGILATLTFLDAPNIAEDAAGTGLDPEMNNETTDEQKEDRKEEVGGWSYLNPKKFYTGLKVIENMIRHRDTTTYDPDDFTSEYFVDRFNKRLAKNAILNFNPKYLKASSTVWNLLNPKIGKFGLNPFANMAKVGEWPARLTDSAASGKIGRFFNRLTNAGADSASKITQNGNVINGLFDNPTNAPVTRLDKVADFTRDKIFPVFKTLGDKFTGTKFGGAVADVASKFIKKAKEILDTIITALCKHFDIAMDERTVVAIADASDRGARVLTEEVTKKSGAKLLGEILSKVAVILNIVFIAKAAIAGAHPTNTKIILGILDEPTWGQRLFAAGINALNEAIPGIGGLLPTEWLISFFMWLFGLIGVDEKNETIGALAESRARAKETVKAYNEQYGHTYNIEEYIKNVLNERTFNEVIKTGFHDAWEETKHAFGFKSELDESDSATNARLNNIEQAKEQQRQEYAKHIEANAGKLQTYSTGIDYMALAKPQNDKPGTGLQDYNSYRSPLQYNNNSQTNNTTVTIPSSSESNPSWLDRSGYYASLYGYGTGGASGVHTSQKGNYSKFGGTNIDSNGCGPAVATTILKSYGVGADINSSAKYAEDKGYVAGSSGIGTRANYFEDILGSNGISTEYSDKPKDIKSAVKSGSPTILLGQDYSNGSKENSPFGPKPHYVVAQGQDKNGNVIIDDPEMATTTVYDKKILNHAKLGIKTGGASGVGEILDTWKNNFLGGIGKSLGGPAGKIFNMIFGISNGDSSQGTNGGANTGGTFGPGGTGPVGSYSGGMGMSGAIPGVPEPVMPDTGHPYLHLYRNRDTEGGVSPCIVGTGGSARAANVLQNCVGYATGRFNEIYDRITGENGLKFGLAGNAKGFISEAQSKYPQLEIGKEPRPGAISVWGGGQYGHVAVVEKVSPDKKTVYLSESHYTSSYPAFVYPVEKPAGGDHCGTFLGYIYNPAVTDAMINGMGAGNGIGPPNPNNPQGDHCRKCVWDFLRQYFSEIAVSGIMGCWWAECSINADRLEADYVYSLTNDQRSEILSSPEAINDYCLNYVFPAYKNGGINQSAYQANSGMYYPGIGLAQWTGPWGEDFYMYCRSKKLNPRSLKVQLQYFWDDLHGAHKSKSVMFRFLEQCQTPEEAARVFYDGYESGYLPGGENYTFANTRLSSGNKRISFANQIYQQFAGSPPGHTSFNSVDTWDWEAKPEESNNPLTPTPLQESLYGNSPTSALSNQLIADSMSDFDLNLPGSGSGLLHKSSKRYKGYNPVDGIVGSGSGLRNKFAKFMGSGARTGKKRYEGFDKSKSSSTRPSPGNTPTIQGIKSVTGNTPNGGVPGIKTATHTPFNVSRADMKDGSGPSAQDLERLSKKISIPPELKPGYDPNKEKKAPIKGKSMSGGASMLPDSSEVGSSALNIIMEYLKQIVTNTGYNVAIPTIVDVLKQSLGVMADMNGGIKGGPKGALSDAQATDTKDSIENAINTMIQRMDAIAGTL